jgi:rhodanese-related sulfurtransferase
VGAVVPAVDEGADLGVEVFGAGVGAAVDGLAFGQPGGDPAVDGFLPLSALIRPGGWWPLATARPGVSRRVQWPRGRDGGRHRPPEETEMNSPVAVPEVMSTDLSAGAFLLDVREDDEWTAGHAPDAVHVRLGELGARVGELPRDREVYVICRSGNRSAYAAQALAASGLNTVNVSDGMTGWAVAGRPMVSEDGTEPHVA